MKQLRTACILLGVLGLLGGVAYWEEQKTKKDEVADKDKNKITGTKPEDVEAIIYQSSADKQTVNARLEKVNGTWVMTEPVKGPAEQQVISSLIESITSYKYESKTSAGKERWQEYGLQTPARTLSLVLKGGKEETIYIGNKAPVGYSVYFRLSSGDSVYIGGQQLLVATEKKLDDFRDKKFVPFKESDLVSVEFKNKKSDLIISRTGSTDPYIASSPKGFDIDSDAVADFLSSLATENAEEIIDAPPKDLVASFAPERRLASLKWQTKTKETGKEKEGEVERSGALIFSEHNKKVYAAVDPSVQAFKIPDAAKTKLEKDLQAFRNKTVLKFEAASVATVEVDGDSFTREKDTWQKKGDDKTPASERPNIQTFVVDLEFAKTDSFPTLSSVAGILKSAPKHRVKLTFTPETNRKDLTLDIWPDPKQPTMAYVRHSDSSQIYHVNQSTFEHLTKKEPAPERAAGASDGEAEEELFAPEEQLAN